MQITERERKLIQELAAEEQRLSYAEVDLERRQKEIARRKSNSADVGERIEAARKLIAENPDIQTLIRREQARHRKLIKRAEEKLIEENYHV